MVKESIFDSQLFQHSLILKTHNYIPFIDILLIFNNSEILILSDREADGILRILWSTRPKIASFVNLSILRKYYKQNISEPNPHFLVIGKPVKWGLGSSLEANMASLLLFNGETSYDT